MPIHLQAGNFPLTWPPVKDTFPVLQDKAHYFDAWLLNHIFQAILNIEEYLILHKDNVENSQRPP